MKVVRLELDHEVVELPVGPLRFFLIAGAVVDLLGAIGFRFMPEQLASMMGVPVPNTDFWPRYSAVFLFVLPFFYLIAAVNPARYLANAAAAVLARFAGFVFYLAMFLKYDSRKAFLVLASMNLAFAVIYWWLLRPTGWSRAWASLRSARELP